MNAEIARNRYVLFTTFRKSGVAVKTAVWIAPLGVNEFGDNEACFTVGGESGKVKRLRNNANVTLQKCDVRGRVVASTPVVVATARVVTVPIANPSMWQCATSTRSNFECWNGQVPSRQRSSVSLLLTLQSLLRLTSRNACINASCFFSSDAVQFCNISLRK